MCAAIKKSGFSDINLKPFASNSALTAFWIRTASRLLIFGNSDLIPNQKHQPTSLPKPPVNGYHLQYNSF
jgi:hypothetical protein